MEFAYYVTATTVVSNFFARHWPKAIYMTFWHVAVIFSGMTDEARSKAFCRWASVVCDLNLLLVYFIVKNSAYM